MCLIYKRLSEAPLAPCYLVSIRSGATSIHQITTKKMFNNLLCKLGDWSLRRSGPSSHTYLPIVRDNPFSEAGATVRAGARTFPCLRLVRAAENFDGARNVRGLSQLRHGFLSVDETPRGKMFDSSCGTGSHVSRYPGGPRRLLTLRGTPS